MTYTNTYSGIKKLEKFSLRSKARKTALDVLSLLDNFKNGAVYETKRIQFIYIHHLFKDEENKLRKLVDFLSQQHLFISYSEAVNRILTNRVDNSYICFSSDDGLKNNIALAQILDEYAIKACFFICPLIIGETDHNKIKAFSAEKLDFPEVEFLNWKDVEQLLKNGHEIGSHTMTHIDMGKAPANIIKDELSQSQLIIKERCGSVPHFAYPYGRYFNLNEQGRKLIFETGYLSCASAERGCHVLQDTPPEKEKLLLRRDHVIVDWNLQHIKYFFEKKFRS